MRRPSAAPPPEDAPRPSASSCSSFAPARTSRSTIRPWRSSAEHGLRHGAVDLRRGSIMFPRMKRFLLLALLPLAASGEIKDRVAAVVNGHPITLSEVEERVAPELARVPAGPT